VEEKKKGENFFVVSPALVTPEYGGFDYKLSAEPTFPLSKPLQQQKVNELMQHPITMGAVQSGYYELGKLADEMMEINDFDPENFKVKEEEPSIIDQTQLLELANRENEAMAAGKRIPPTAYSNRAHTDVHLAYIDSNAFRQALAQNQEILTNMIYHVQGEGQAQEMRQQGKSELGVAPRAQRTVGQGIEQGEAKAAMPGRLLGAEAVPEGING